MDKLRVFWPEVKVVFNGKGIGEAWKEEFLRTQPYEETKDFREADVAFFASDSVIVEEVIGKIPTVCMFWGWEPMRMLSEGYRGWANDKCGVMDRLTSVLVPSLTTFYQACNLGIRPIVLTPGVDESTLNRYRVDTVKKIQLVFVSRLTPHKNLSLLLEACALLEPKIPLVVCGSGDYSQYLLQVRSLDIPVKFVSPSDEEKVLIICESSILIHPSSYEGFSLPPLEAMYLGTPVIVSDIPQHRHLLKEFASYHTDAQNLALVISEALNNWGITTQRAAFAQRFVSGIYTLSQASSSLSYVLHESIRAFLGDVLKRDPSRWKEVYERDHRRNGAYKSSKFDPSWSRHWRAQHFLSELGGEKKKIIDIGCGAVYPTIFAMAGHEVTGYDVADEALRQAREIAAQHGVEIATQQGFAQRTPYPDETFDAAVLGEILEHVQDPSIVLKEAYRIVKKGGRIICSTPVGHHHFDPLHIASNDGGWDEKGLDTLLQGYKVITRRQIAEEATDPSCYLFTVERE